MSPIKESLFQAISECGWQLKSKIKGSLWPVLPSAKTAAVLTMLGQLEQTQWLSEADLRARQYQQILPLLKHAVNNVPFYQSLYQDIKLPARLDDEFFTTLPLVTRQTIQEQGRAFYSSNIPDSHGRASIVSTSGSTGSPLNALASDIVRFYWDVFTMRDHLWHKRDLNSKLAIIRYLASDKGIFPEDITVKGWGCVAGEMMHTGPAGLLNIKSSIADMVHWLNDFQPDTLLLHPSILDELLRDEKLSGQLELGALREIRTLAEALSPETRVNCRNILGVKLVDVYSTIELGYIALQCPEYEHYHIQAENVLVEILDDHGNACQPGEVGRIVVTSLHNYASPFIRYELGDYVELGQPCPCGRGLPVVNRINGRYRNLLTYPDGHKVFPVFNFAKYQALGAIRQFQLVQTSLYDLTFRLNVSRPLSPAEQHNIIEKLLETLGFPFHVSFEFVDTIRHSKNGKYEEFVSLI